MKTQIRSVVLALVLCAAVALAGCGGKAGERPIVSVGEVRAWDVLLDRSIGIVRLAVATQPPGDRRTKVLAVIDAVQNWEDLGAAVSLAVSEGFEVKVPATQPASE